MKRLFKSIEKTFIRQQDSSDCGVACLRAVARFHGGDFSMESLRELSGTSKEGTTLLGLFEAAQKIGFDAAANRIHISDLHSATGPLILHVTTKQGMLHYVVWYQLLVENGEVFHLIGDPATGLVKMSEQELTDIWESKVRLSLSPGPGFVLVQERERKKWAWFKSLILDDSALLVSAAVLGVLVALTGLAMAIFSQKLVDSILPLKNQNKLVLGVIFVFFILLARIILDSIRTYLLLSQSKIFNNRINENFQKALLRLPNLFFNGRCSGDLIARMNDIARIQEVISQLAGQFLVDVLVVIASCVVVYMYSWQAAIAVAFGLPAFFVLIYNFRKSIAAKQQQVMVSYAALETNYINTLQGISAIKAYDRQDFFRELNQSVYGMNQKHIFELGLVKLRLTSLASFAGLTIQMMVVMYVSYRVLQGELKTGELMAILALTSVMLPSVSNLALLAIPFNEAKIALDRLFEFVDLPGEDTAANPTLPSEIEIRTFEMVNVSFKFPGRPRMLNEISITAHKGEIIGIIGPSGSGKTSLLNLIERIYTPSQGEIRVNEGVDISSINLSTWRKAVTCVPQQVHLFNGTVMDNILLGRPYEESLLGQLLENSELVKFISSLPQGLNTLVGQNGANVSGGQKQWIGLMRALYYKPQLLLLDEITAGMDYQSELEAIELLKRFRSQMIIVFVSHRLHTLPILCERTYIMGDNKIIAAGQHSELLQAKNIYSEFWNAFGDN